MQILESQSPALYQYQLGFCTHLGDPKLVYFIQKMNWLQGKCCILKIDVMRQYQKLPKSYFQSQFLCQKPFFFGFKNINLGDHFFIYCFLTSIFEPLYFLKSCPIFDELALHIFSKYNGCL